MPCPPMDATSSVAAAAAAKKMSRGPEKKKKPSQSSSSSSSSSSWIARSMGFYHYHHSSTSTSTSSMNRAQQPAPPPAAAEGKNINSDDKQSNCEKKKRSSISRSMTCAGSMSICSTKESSVTSRDGDHGLRGAGRSASSRSLTAPPDLDVVADAVYASTAAAISATSSFNSDTTTAASTVTTTTTSSSSPLSSALSSRLSSIGSSFRGVQQIRKLSGGCYQCHSVFDPSSFAAGAAAFPCADCDEVFVKAESLELHRATRHAVSELGPEDTSRNIVEIIFQSSWLKKQGPVCKIERIIKVQSSKRTVKWFEQYKESIRERASIDQSKKNPRCVADGNELLRFHCATFTCSLGVGGGTALCRSSSPSAQPQCMLCIIIRDGFRVDGDGKIATMATSGRAHDMAQVLSESDKRAMLVCRVVAGRVKKVTDEKCSEDDDCDFDSVSLSSEGVYSDLDELFVFNPRAILPCFVVIYSGY